MKDLEDFDSIDELKKAISHLTQKYEQLKHDERATKIAEARDIIESYELTAEELGFSQATPPKKPPIEKTVVRRKPSTAIGEPTPNSGQQGLW